MAAVPAKQQYDARKAARRCVKCAAGLQEADGVLCVECREANDAYVPPPHVREKILANKRAKAKAHYAANRDAERERIEARRLNRLTRGICGCCPEPALEDSAWCEGCREVMRARAKERARRRRHPEKYVGVPWPKFTTKRAPAPEIESPPPPDPAVAAEPMVWQRLLRAATHYDVVTNADLREHLGLGDQDSNRISVHMRRLVQKGYLAPLGGRTGSEAAYSVTAEGRRAA